MLWPWGDCIAIGRGRQLGAIGTTDEWPRKTLKTRKGAEIWKGVGVGRAKRQAYGKGMCFLPKVLMELRGGTVLSAES